MLLVNVIELSKNSLNRECVYTFYIIYFILYVLLNCVKPCFMQWHTEEVCTKINKT